MMSAQLHLWGSAQVFGLDVGGKTEQSSTPFPSCSTLPLCDRSVSRFERWEGRDSTRRWWQCLGSGQLLLSSHVLLLNHHSVRKKHAIIYTLCGGAVFVLSVSMWGQKPQDQYSRWCSLCRHVSDEADVSALWIYNPMAHNNVYTGTHMWNAAAFTDRRHGHINVVRCLEEDGKR